MTIIYDTIEVNTAKEYLEIQEVLRVAYPRIKLFDKCGWEHPCRFDVELRADEEEYFEYLILDGCACQSQRFMQVMKEDRPRIDRILKKIEEERGAETVHGGQDTG